MHIRVKSASSLMTFTVMHFCITLQISLCKLAAAYLCMPTYYLLGLQAKFKGLLHLVLPFHD